MSRLISRGCVWRCRIAAAGRVHRLHRKVPWKDGTIVPMVASTEERVIGTESGSHRHQLCPWSGQDNHDHCADVAGASASYVAVDIFGSGPLLDCACC